MSLTIILGPAAPAVDWTGGGNPALRNHISSPKDQMLPNTCVAFAATAVVEAMISIEKDLSVNLSEADLAFCSPIQQGRVDVIDEIFNHVKIRGIHLDTDFAYATAFPDNNPWGGGAGSCRLNLSANPFFRIRHIHSFSSIAETKQYLTHVGPVTTSILLYTDFKPHRAGIYSPTPTSVRDAFHAITLIGYNDAGGYWLCKNSWGPLHGVNGFSKIAYDTCGITDTSLKVGVTGTRKISP